MEWLKAGQRVTKYGINDHIGSALGTQVEEAV